MSAPRSLSKPIEDYALIGDTQAAALVARDGCIDWLCLPRFDSPAVFAALLGSPEHGHFSLAPLGAVTHTTRRYRSDTLILETDFQLGDAVVRLVDFMPPRGREPDVVRIVQGIRGHVRMRLLLRARLDYGALTPWIEADRATVRLIAGPDALVLRTPVPLSTQDGDVTAEFDVHEGEEVPFVLEWHPSHEPSPGKRSAATALAETESYWREWIGRCTYRGPWAEPVRSSLVVLKALTYGPTGGIVAAPTTSLPERIGGVRNWDYRYCWLRDATFTLYALLTSGYHEEAAAWRDWLLRAVAGHPAEMQIMYGIDGARRLPELTLDWLPGYEASRPVRIGNAAATQFQLDVFGEVMDVLHHARRLVCDVDVVSWRVQQGLLDFLESKWREPDEGLWEVRGPRQHFTHSKLMAWVAFDRAVKAVELFGLPGPADRWRALRSTLHEEICAKGFNASVGAFTQAYGSSALDASLLILPIVGFLPADDARVIGTVRAIDQTLIRDGLVLRYLTEHEESFDGLPPGEGAFLACSFWLADNYVLMGRQRDASELFERLLALRNDVGLLAEEYDPRARRQLGNFPQAFSHVGLVNTAWNLTCTPDSPARKRQNAGDGASRGGQGELEPRT